MIVLPFKDSEKKKEYSRRYYREYMKKYRSRPDQKTKRASQKEERQKEKAEMLTTFNQTLELLNPYDINALLQLDSPHLKSFYKDYGDYRRNLEQEQNESEDDFKERQSFSAYQRYCEDESEWINTLKTEQKQAVRKAIVYLEQTDSRMQKWMNDFPEFFSKWI